MSQQAQPKTFEIGLAMAGAASAGAYTAGVLDFLIEALAEWEKARGANDVPPHRVVIKVLTGASAGAITSAVGTVALAGGLRPQKIPTDDSGIQISAVLPTLYDTWVVKPRMVSTDGSPDLLSTDDLKPVGGKKPDATSCLNAKVLDSIKDAALQQPVASKPYAYVAEKLHVYLMISNMRGIPYSVEFAGGNYGMQTHGDRAHYVVKGLGTTPAPSSWADGDAFLPLQTGDLFGQNGPAAAWADYAGAAVASAAFPIGFAPRPIKTQTSDYEKRRLPIDAARFSDKPPTWPTAWLGKTPPRAFNFLSVDGGVINNEPFEYARYTLMEAPGVPNKRKGEEADRAVIMVDPFPEPPDFLPDDKPASDIVSIAAALLPTLINQARFKPGELVEASDETVYSRYLIAPHRHLDGKDKEEFYSIACGLSGGFGGFFDEGFRRHDFQLGRRNCQRFLKEVFAVPEQNPIIQTWSPGAKAKFHTTADPAKPNDKPQYCIIPVMGSAAAEVRLLSWPRMTVEDFETLQERIKQRLTRVVSRLIEGQTKSRFVRFFFKVAAGAGESKIIDYVRYTILSDMLRRDQIAGWDLSSEPNSDDARKVIAELANPAFDLRSVASLARTTLLAEDRVSSVLQALGGKKGKPYSIWSTKYDGKDVYTLDVRKPGFARSIPVVGWLIDWFAALVID